MDIIALTDEALAVLQEAVEAERERRAILAQSQAAADALSEQYQSAVEAALPEGEYLTWEQPTGAHNAYRMGQVVSHNGSDWRSKIPSNVWEPTTANYQWWTNLTVTPEPGVWSGSGVAYKVNDIVTFEGKSYRCVQAHTSQAGWTPTAVPALWALVGK